MPIANLDYADIQGLVRYGHGHMTEACFLLLEIKNPAAARAWLAAAPITSAMQADPRPITALQVAFTCEGLRALGVSEDLIGGFAPEFISGMAGEESRSRRLGDIGANAPDHWGWGGPTTSVPHVLLLLYAEASLATFQATVEAQLSDGFHPLAYLSTANLDGYEPFGFSDSISQPALDWNQERRVEGDQLEYSNLVTLGEFLLGYPNEYGQYTDRPLLPPEQDPQAQLPVAEDQSPQKDLGRNGTYLVFRQLQQDVRGFWQFLDRQANSNPEVRKKLAEAMVGRTMDGEPLASLAAYPILGVEDTRLNQFTYEADPAGARCPRGAHIRRANPRNGDLPYGTLGFLSRWVRILGFGRKSIDDDLIASTRFHRLLRRSREYGNNLLLAEALQPGHSDGEKRGLHFICLNANIGRQFEFVQNAWMMSTKFDGLSEESDPLLGNREPLTGCPVTNIFSLPQENGVRHRITAMPQFVTVRGGAYFFLPGLRALRYIARLSG